MNNRSSFTTEFVNPTKMGYAHRDITPDRPMNLIGFNREDSRSRGILDPLYTQVCILQQENRRYCLITVDSIGFTIEYTSRLRQKIAAAVGTSVQQVMVCFSHTHAVPNADDEPNYREFVYRQAVEAAKQALCSMEPVYAGWAGGEAEVGVNRRVGGSVLDKRISMIQMMDPARKRRRLILLRLTAHGNVLMRDNYFVSADFFGAVRKALEKRYGCPVMVTQGASGNVSPRYQGKPEDLDKMAHEVLQAVNKLQIQIKPGPIPTIHMFSHTEQFESPVPSQKQAEKIAQEAREQCGIDGSGWLEEVRRLQKAGIVRQKSPVELQFFFFQGCCWCGVAQEIMCEAAVEIAAKAGNTVYLGGYTNGCDGYLPSREEHRKGGYETVWSYLLYYPYHKRVMSFEEDAADRIIQAVVGVCKDER